MIKILLIMLCFTYIPLAYATKEEVWEIASHERLVRYTSHGTTVYGHQFGFIKKAGVCESDVMWLSWSTDSKGIEVLSGSDFTFQFRIDGTEFEIQIPLLYANESLMVTTILIFTNYLASEQLISLLEKGKKIDAEVIGPQDYLDLFDIPVDSFNLNGFVKARDQAKEVCESMGTVKLSTI